MPLQLKEGWENVNIPSKTYNSGPRDRVVIDETMNKLREQGKVEPAT
jgi:hypothetical protein